MEKEQIIKALEWCSNVQLCCLCPVGKERGEPKSMHDCGQALMKDALALIKELTVELDAMRGAANSYKMHNERITEENERLSTALAEYEYKTNIRIAEEYYTAEAYDELREENDRLKAEVSVKKKMLDKCLDLEDRVKADTVREMRKIFEERLDISVDGYSTEEVRSEIFDTFDRIANEILNKNTEECTDCKHFAGCEPSTLGVCDMYEEEEKK